MQAARFFKEQQRRLDINSLTTSRRVSESRFTTIIIFDWVMMLIHISSGPELLRVVQFFLFIRTCRAKLLKHQCSDSTFILCYCVTVTCKEETRFGCLLSEEEIEQLVVEEKIRPVRKQCKEKLYSLEQGRVCGGL